MFTNAAVLMCGLVAGMTVPLIHSDLRFRLLPNHTVLPGYPVLALICVERWVRTGDVPLDVLGSGALWFGLFCIAAISGGLGMGDVKLGGLLGASLGLIAWPISVVGLVFVGFGAGVAGAAAVWRRRATHEVGSAGPRAKRSPRVGRRRVELPRQLDLPRQHPVTPRQPLRAGFELPADPYGREIVSRGIPLGPILLAGYWMAVGGAVALYQLGVLPP